MLHSIFIAKLAFRIKIIRVTTDLKSLKLKIFRKFVVIMNLFFPVLIGEKSQRSDFS